MSPLKEYKQKRNFTNTPEPEGKKAAKGKALRYVVQRHQASRLHYDFRLELGGVLKSWAVPKGPSLNTSDKRLAVHVEDHPVDYISFSGEIPKGNYGAGTVEIWDAGIFVAVDGLEKPITEKKAIENIEKGEIKFVLDGDKLKGGFVLVRLKDDEKNWLLIKHKDEFAVTQKYNSEDLPSVKKKEIKAVGSPVRTPFTGKEKKLASFSKPMLASLHNEAFDSKEWLFEIKWDGYRAIADLGGSDTRFYSRNGLSFSETFPPVYSALSKIKKKAILDGEVVVLNEEGKPDFQMLQQYREDPSHPIIYYVFDLLSLEGQSIMHLPLVQRKELLRLLLKDQGEGVIRYCDHVMESGVAFFSQVTHMDLEGMIAKFTDSEYSPGLRSKQWLKIKNVNSREAVIAGYTRPKGSRKHFGALILGAYSNCKLEYIGHTGTGFNDKLLKELALLMKPLETSVSPFKERIKVNDEVTWVNPSLVCQVKFTEQTRDGKLRHPVFLGLRVDKSAEEVDQQNETVAKKENNMTTSQKKVENERQVTIDKNEVKLTNLDKIFWPADKITKGEMLTYYEKIAPVILPYLKDRPLSLKRNPNGIEAKAFYHKDAGENAPSFVITEKVESESSDKVIDYIVCNNAATLLYVANLGSIEMNPWNSTRKKPDHPTYIVIDIDPSDNNSFEQVIETAQAAGQVLDRAGATYYCKTSGASGLHIYIPLNNKYEYEPAKNFAHIVAMLTQELVPDFTTLERMVAKRGDRIYIDYLQNRKGQTLASAYSVRPVPGACVSTPLTWKEVKKGLHPSQFNIYNVHKRIEKLGDIFYQVLGKGNDIRNCLKNLGQ